MLTVCITGASGFVGKNLTQYLSPFFKISHLSLRDSEWKFQVDKNIYALIHLAGKAHDTSNTASVDEYFRINRDLTIELFNFFIESEIKDFYYFSSVKAVADTVQGILTEDTPAAPLTPYGISKREAEIYLLQQELPKDKRLFIIRPCMIHGEGNKGNLNFLYNTIGKGFPWPLGTFENERSFLSIENLSFFIHQMLQNKDLPSGIYNFADDQGISTNELVRIISNTLGKKPKLWNVPSQLIKNVAKLGDMLSLPLNSERLKKLTDSYLVSNRKIKHELGINKLPLTAQEGLIKTIQSFKKN